MATELLLLLFVGSDRSRRKKKVQRKGLPGTVVPLADRPLLKTQATPGETLGLPTVAKVV